jgi:hypothetical protein
MQPHVAMVASPMTEPHMERWNSISPRSENDPSTFKFTTNLFSWWRRQLVVIKDFPYAGVYFRGIVDLVLPEGIQWDASGMEYYNLVTIFFFLFFYMFLVVQ